ncbi:site-specific recombinase XerC [Haloactinospora alba]|uniref:Site-specific recombinase XerC n=1 Tax=Haloactinospora alba TaxID=405555 RepID=A0A543NLB1_9ACTN|nr:site-specific integrase [Haloactinospora alba]TQN32628.1 site-specific recombinase XerC [Haloactinospora alba]
MNSYDVRFWSVKTNRKKNPTTGKSQVTSHTVRWTVAGREKSRTFKNREGAKNFLSDLRQAAKSGEAFDVSSGLPDSSLQGPTVTWFEHALSYVDHKWSRSSAKERISVAEGLTAVTLALVKSTQGAPDGTVLRRALRRWSFNVVQRDAPKPSEVETALRWLERNSLPLTALEDPRTVTAALDACARRLDGKPAAPEYYRRRRRAFSGALKYAVRLDRLRSNPLDDKKAEDWKPPTVVATVDRRRVANADQIRNLLDAIGNVGSTQGPRLVALYGCMYYGMLRPQEAVSLEGKSCELPEEGWGALDFEAVYSAAGKEWTDAGEVHEERGLKGRPVNTRRRVPIPPVLVSMLRTHIEQYGLASDGRLFRTYTGGKYQPSTLWRVLQVARETALTEDQVGSPLASTPYDFRHAGISLRLNAGTPPALVAEWAGHSVEVLYRVYAHCLDGDDDRWFGRIEDEMG